MIAGLDAFNPCAFFVLLFLLSLLVHARSRARMPFIGGVFVLFSGLIYFLFMAAWLNLFLWLGELRLVTLGAGVLAVLVALVNVKDYFWFRRGPSLSIPEGAKPGLYQRMRGLLRADCLPALTLGTVALALAVTAIAGVVYGSQSFRPFWASGEFPVGFIFESLLGVWPLFTSSPISLSSSRPATCPRDCCGCSTTAAVPLRPGYLYPGPVRAGAADQWPLW